MAVKKPQMVRQGDVLLIPVARIPRGAKKVKPEPRGVVIAEGEASGHAHVLPADKVALSKVGDVAFVTVAKTATLTHEEHRPLSIVPGVYEVRHQRQYEPSAIGEAAAEYRTQALGEVFWLAFQQLSEDDQGAFVRRLLGDPEWYEDIYDSISIIQARNEPSRPFEEFEEDLRRDGLL